MKDDGELADINKLKRETQKKLRILNDAEIDSDSTHERSDEFLRNFFIKFGMRKTLESFQ